MEIVCVLMFKRLQVNIKSWDNLLDELREGNKRTRWTNREPYAYWKGNPVVPKTRQDLLKLEKKMTSADPLSLLLIGVTLIRKRYPLTFYFFNKKLKTIVQLNSMQHFNFNVCYLVNWSGTRYWKGSKWVYLTRIENFIKLTWYWIITQYICWCFHSWFCFGLACLNISGFSNALIIYCIFLIFILYLIYL